MRTIAFIIPPTVELLDLAGPVQVFTEAKFYGMELNIEFFLYQRNPVSTSGLTFGSIANFADAKLKEGDFVFVPGMAQTYVRTDAFKSESNFFTWLKVCAERGITVCSVCNGAFALGYAQLLNDAECTTHWRRTQELQVQFPDAKVLEDRLFVKNRMVCTSGGIGAGIDLGLSILEDLTSAHFASKVARGLVVYRRSNGNQKPEGMHMIYRNHVNSKVHDVQDYLDINQTLEPSTVELAAIAGVSPQQLTLAFEEATGISLDDYLTQSRNTNKTIH